MPSGQEQLVTDELWRLCRVHDLGRRTCAREINCASSFFSGAIIELKVAHRSHGIKELIAKVVE